MDPAQLAKLSSLNHGVLKEPRGFMKVLQFIFAICAFGVVTNYSSTFAFKVMCDSRNGTTIDTTTIEYNIHYPFRIDHLDKDQKICGKVEEVPLHGDFSNDSKFFVCVGVLSFLYTIIALGVYIFLNEKYSNMDMIPIGDLVVTVILSVFWLAGSSAWANSLSGLKVSTSPSVWFDKAKFCSATKCIALFTGNYAGLNVSVILGFLNFALWSSNLWFLYKETSWFKNRAESQNPTGNQGP